MANPVKDPPVTERVPVPSPSWGTPAPPNPTSTVPPEMRTLASPSRLPKTKVPYARSSAMTSPPDTLTVASPSTLPMAGVSVWRWRYPSARKSTVPPEMETSALPLTLPMPGTFSCVIARTEPPSMDTEALPDTLPMAGASPSLVASTRASPVIRSGMPQRIAGRPQPVETKVPPAMATAAVLALGPSAELSAMPVLMSLETCSVLPLSPSNETTGSVAGGAVWLVFATITETPLPRLAPFRLAWAPSSVTMEMRGVPLEPAIALMTSADVLVLVPLSSGAMLVPSARRTVMSELPCASISRCAWVVP